MVPLQARLIEIQMEYIPDCPIVDKSTLVQEKACRLAGDKPLPEAMLTKISGFV